jgi:hypothetical protein
LNLRLLRPERSNGRFKIERNTGTGVTVTVVKGANAGEMPKAPRTAA